MPQPLVAQAPARSSDPEMEAVWTAFVEAIRVDVGVKDVVNILGSEKKLRPIFLAAAARARSPAHQSSSLGKPSF